MTKQSFEEMMNLFDIKQPLTMESLKRAKKKLLLLHPDKNKVDTTEHYTFFRDVYEKLVKIYSYIHHETNEDVLKKDIDIDNTFKTFIEKNNIHPVKNKEKYLKHFNEMFENIYLKNEDEEYGHEEWLKTKGEYDLNDLEGSRKKLIEHNALIKIDIEGTNVFNNKYSDVKEAHINSIIGLDQDKLFKEKPKFNSVDEYKKHREMNKGNTMTKEDSLKQIEEEEKQQKMNAISLSYKYMEQEETMNKKKKEYVSKYLLISEF
uniref:J domain-containing protein n=1 Tax=viral metagenome TaxID=1070528 RepID=A0A6C0EUT0_9ZZZZ